jgi:hypothetical protein
MIGVIALRCGATRPCSAANTVTLDGQAFDAILGDDLDQPFRLLHVFVFRLHSL